MSTPCLEIVLACYNGQNYIAEQLRSLQECFGYADIVERVLVVDDASSDDSASIVACIAESDPRIVWISAEGERRGVVRNFDRGLRLTHSPYVMLCDQDDVWLTEKISCQLELCLKHEKKFGPKTPLLIFSDLLVVNDKLQTISSSFFSYQKIKPEWVEKIENLLMQNVAPGCTFFLNRALVEKALPIPEQAVMHDWWLLLVARVFGQVLWLDKSLVKYRQHSGNQVGAKRINWHWVFSWRRYRRQSIHSLKRQSVQAQFFQWRFQKELSQQLKEKELIALRDICLLHSSSLGQRLNGFVGGQLRKNSILRNIGLFVVLIFWDKDKKS